MGNLINQRNLNFEVKYLILFCFQFVIGESGDVIKLHHHHLDLRLYSFLTLNLNFYLKFQLTHLKSKVIPKADAADAADLPRFLVDHPSTQQKSLSINPTTKNRLEAPSKIPTIHLKNQNVIMIPPLVIFKGILFQLVKIRDLLNHDVVITKEVH